MNQRIHDQHSANDVRISYVCHYAVVEGMGTVLLEICVKCSYVRAACLHTMNKWHGEPAPEGDLDTQCSQRLLCDLCGVDGT